jgi:catechol 2,3-dioxygenase-like lactoylglutathione lyase family enzyme
LVIQGECRKREDVPLRRGSADAIGSGLARDWVTVDFDATDQPEGREMTRHGADLDRRSEWDDLRARHLASPEVRPTSSARGVHHLALLSSDVERTIVFYQDLLEFPLTELFENRDYQGSTHFFFDIGNGNLLAFFDFPGLDLGDYAEVLGGMHHLAISVEHARWQHLKDKLDTAGVSYEHMSGSSLYFNGPDGERLELIRDPLGEMYGAAVL